MGSSAVIATLLDRELLEVIQGVTVASPMTPDDMLPQKTGVEVGKELAGRYLLRYVLPQQVGEFTKGSTGRHCVTPTPYAPEDTVWCLALPRPKEFRTHVMFLRPDNIQEILGPRLVRGGIGVEYVLPRGFPEMAIISPPWEREIR